MLQSDKAKGYFALFITSIVWGTTWVASKIGVSEIPALQMAYIRQFIGGTIFISFFVFYKKLPLPTIKQFRWLFVMAIIVFVSANGLSTWGIQYIPAGLGALIGALYPLCVVVLEKIFFKSKRMTALTFFGLFLGICGIAIVFYENAFHHAGTSFLLGIFLSLVAVLSWSLGTIFIARNKVEINPYYGVGWQMLISSIILFIVSESTLPVVPFKDISSKTWWVIVYLIVFGSIMAFVAFIYSLKKLPAAISSLYAYINPLVAMVFGVFVLNEKMSSNIAIGALVTLVGVYLVNYSVKKAEKIIIEAEI
ncbi:MAG: EamA family transporter [Ferruginibacter sp.]|nr:EamA family transporter [Ferruginibacter sp.]